MSKEQQMSKEKQEKDFRKNDEISFKGTLKSKLQRNDGWLRLLYSNVAPDFTVKFIGFFLECDSTTFQANKRNIYRMHGMLYHV